MCLQFESTYPLTAIANAKPNSMPFPELKQYIVKYQNPGEADAITKIQKELDETTKTTRLAVEALLDRGEKIDSLVAKSETLSTQSKMFYTQVG
jgi:synaptobrevin family protein YKT6